jgi:hypothetical protein
MDGRMTIVANNNGGGFSESTSDAEEFFSVDSFLQDSFNH